ncbi:arsenicals resistance, partial [Friedmanniomyces endolithicus]
MNTIEPGVADDARPDAGLGRVNSNELSRVKGGEAVDDDNIELGEVDADGRKNHDNNGTQNNDEPITAPPFKALSFLDRLLVLWIILSMAIGIILGNLIPSVGPALQRGTFVGVSGPIAAGLLVMMYPILCK